MRPGAGAPIGPPSRAPAAAAGLHVFVLHLLAVALRAGAEVLVEHADHFDRAAEPALVGDEADLLSRPGEQFARAADAAAVDLAEDRVPDLVLKPRLQAAEGDAGGAGDVTEAQGFLEILRDVTQRPRDL